MVRYRSCVETFENHAHENRCRFPTPKLKATMTNRLYGGPHRDLAPPIFIPSNEVASTDARVKPRRLVV